MDIDIMFGSDKFKLGTNMNKLLASARKILRNPIDVNIFNQKEFLRTHTDIIAINHDLSNRMKKRFRVDV